MDAHSHALALERYNTILEVNKWREVQDLQLAAVPACAGLGSCGFGSPALQPPSPAGYKILHVNLRNKTKCDAGECCSVRVFPHPVLSKEERLNTVIFFYFRRTGSEVGKHFPQGLCLPVYLENMGDASCEWEKNLDFKLRKL